MSRYRSQSATLRKRSSHKQEDSLASARDFEGIPLVRNCSSCLDLYDRMIGITRLGDISHVEVSGDSLDVGEVPNHLQPDDLPEPMGEANDYELPSGSDGEFSSNLSGAGSCVLLYRKDANKWHVGRDWQDLFDVELVVAREPTRDQASGSTLPFQTDFACGGQENDLDLQVTEDNADIDQRVKPNSAKFDKATNTGHWPPPRE